MPCCYEAFAAVLLCRLAQAHAPQYDGQQPRDLHPAPRRSRSNVDFVGGEEMAKIQEGLLAKAKRRQAKARS